uniref:Uncharacterized protein n=1 Tax=Glossina austeni TaxID=7395 RepID=A0A1A9VM54_GLOAU
MHFKQNRRRATCQEQWTTLGKSSKHELTDDREEGILSDDTRLAKCPQDIKVHGPLTTTPSLEFSLSPVKALENRFIRHCLGVQVVALCFLDFFTGGNLIAV